MGNDLSCNGVLRVINPKAVPKAQKSKAIFDNDIKFLVIFGGSSRK